MVVYRVEEHRNTESWSRYDTFEIGFSSTPIGATQMAINHMKERYPEVDWSKDVKRASINGVDVWYHIKAIDVQD